jgi:hypothetical protein
MEAKLASFAELSRQKALNAQTKAEKNAVAARNEKKAIWSKVQVELRAGDRAKRGKNNANHTIRIKPCTQYVNYC